MSRPPKVRTERTDKKWKLMQLFAVGMFLFGIFTITSGGLSLILLAIVVSLIATFGAFWTNG